MESVPDSSYDSDDSLPDIDELCPPQTLEIKEGEIVWAKYRKYYWPSLIRKVFKKERKVSLWYLDTPKKCFKVSFNNIHAFVDRSFIQNVVSAIRESPMKSLHEQVVYSTWDYIKRRDQGIKDDPGVFFDRSICYLLKCVDLKFSANEPNSSLAQGESLQRSLNEGYTDCSKEESVVGSEDEESVVGSEDEESIVDSEDEEKFKKLRDELKLDEDDFCFEEDKDDAIVACITSGKVNKYLLGINSLTIPSERQKCFEEYKKTGNFNLLVHESFKIIRNDSKLYEIFHYLQDYYESIVEKGERNMYKYVYSVWLPEALNKTLELIEGVSEGTSESEANQKNFISDENCYREEINDLNGLKSNSESPNQNFISHKRKPDSLKQSRSSPKRRPNTPKKTLTSPKKRSDSPKKTRTSPRKQNRDNAIMLVKKCKSVESSSKMAIENDTSSEHKSSNILSTNESGNSTVPECKRNHKNNAKKKISFKESN